MKIKPLFWIIAGLLFLIPCIGMLVMKNWYDNKIDNYQKASFIIIDKGTMSLKVYDLQGDVVKEYPVGVAKNYGNKQKKGDYKTPEGVFRVQEIQDASNWKHDFGDGKGEIPGAYGPFFIRLYTPPHKGIGIHGTHDPASIGTRCTEGCIRLQNENVRDLKNYVYPGLPVVILPSDNDVNVNASYPAENP